MSVGGRAVSKKLKINNHSVANDGINRTIIVAVELRELVFATSDETLIRTMDLLMYNLSKHASKIRIQGA